MKAEKLKVISSFSRWRHINVVVDKVLSRREEVDGHCVVVIRCNSISLYVNPSDVQLQFWQNSGSGDVDKGKNTTVRSLFGGRTQQNFLFFHFLSVLN